MLTTLLAARLPAVSGARVGAVMGRNVASLRSGPSYWIVLVSGFFEPLLYLLSIGVGVGALIGELRLEDGRVLSYAVFVAPAMLAVSAMTGVLAETTFNFFFKMKYSKTFEAILATPVGPLEVALGELSWAVVRGSFYTAVFIGVMVAMDLVSLGWALAAFPATVLVGFAFGAVGMALSTLMRGWQDFDLLNTGQFALFLFSGTFAPVQAYPLGVEILIQLTPLYHAVELVRGLALGSPGPGLLLNTAYLVAMALAGLLFAARRVERLLCA
ncbi:ABC transporter permease [Allonocardiopsis opalescens]|uniref:Transport permease protein n=1 Tax=Allonocardiopsis opalescens TaxID=1144618 RepID=A0A2T0Q7X8_9ACTN|nr:ABC transporter permease [Allonocardiopsis opalescens]PRX99935.1 lipooligosaccharide transport system permease protein [Allonocardiopsis opalescens]